MPSEAMLKSTWPAGASVEQRFVLSLIGQQTPQRVHEWRELLPAVNWSQLLEVTRPDLYPYLHFCIHTRVGAEFCPRGVLQQLASSRQVTAVRNLRRLAELREIQAALAAQDIPIIALKGIALAFVAYPDPSLRPMNDMDLFLDLKHLDSALRTLKDLGYVCPDRFSGLHIEGEAKLQKLGTPQSLIELHTQIEVTAPLSRAAGDIWSHAVKTRISDFDVYTLDEQEFLFHLCLHLARRHTFTTGFLPFLDILKWVEKHAAGWDWPSLFRVSQSREYSAYIEPTLDLARDFLSVPVPPALVSNLPRLTVLKDIAWHQLTDDRLVRNVVPPGLVELLDTGSWSARLSALLKRFQPAQGNLSAFLRLLRALLLGNLSRTRVQHQVQLRQQRAHLAALLGNKDSNAPEAVLPYPSEGSHQPAGATGAGQTK